MTTDLNAYLPSASSGDGLTIAKPWADGLATSLGSWYTAGSSGGLMKKISGLTGTVVLTLDAGAKGSVLTALNGSSTSSAYRLDNIVLDGATVFDADSLGIPASNDSRTLPVSGNITTAKHAVGALYLMPFYDSLVITLTAESTSSILLYSYSDLA